MEISFENTSVGSYREISRQTRRFQESAEGVVPDVNDDIGRVLSAHGSVLLKSKELSGRGVYITGELRTALLYVTESADRVAVVKLSREFHLDFEIPETEGERLAVVRLAVVHAEGRALNPRKVSVTAEMTADLSVYAREDFVVDTALPEQNGACLHLRTAEEEAILINAVCEKTFAVSEQFSFPEGMPVPTELVWQDVDFRVTDCQQLGSRLIVKGSAELTVCCLPEGEDCPFSARFSSGFSQILDVPEEAGACRTVQIQPCSGYFQLIELMGGGKALDAEIHAVLQLVNRRPVPLRYIADAYSNRMPARCSYRRLPLPRVSEMEKLTLSGRERLTPAGEEGSVLWVWANPGQPAPAGQSLSVPVQLDLLCRGPGGELTAARRTMELEGPCPEGELRILNGRVDRARLLAESGEADFTLELELCCQRARTVERSAVDAVSLDEEQVWDLCAAPSLTLARAEGESLWELAKRYRSSVEGILALNGDEESCAGKMLLIPRERV